MKMASGSCLYVHQGMYEFHCELYIRHLSYYNMWLTLTLLFQAEPTADQAGEGP